MRNAKAREKEAVTIKELPKFTVGSGNVFADLGVSDPDVALAKAQLAQRLIDIMDERGLTQHAAAKMLELDQPKVSAIVHGRLRGFSVERLMQLLTRFNQDVAIVVTPAETIGRFTAMVPIATATD